MGGGGADILLIDIISWYKYADMGYLEDLRVYMEQGADFNKGDLRTNIIDAMEYRGGVYTLPISFRFNLFAYDATFFNDGEKELLSAKSTFTFGELIDIAAGAFERNNGGACMFGLTGGVYDDWHIFKYLLAENYTSFVDLANKKASFDDGRFEKLLLSVTDYCKKGYIGEHSEITQLIVGDIMTSPDERFFYKLESSATSALLRSFDKELPGLIINMPYNGNYDDDIIAGMAADNNGNITFNPTSMYALNSNSKKKHAAWEFIKILLSEEIQGEFEMVGIPVNRNALEEREIMSLKVGGYRANPLNDNNRQAFNDYLECLNKYSDMLNTYTIRDKRIDDWIGEEAALYFKGEKSAKNVAKALQNKVNLYLNE